MIRFVLHSWQCTLCEGMYHSMRARDPVDGEKGGDGWLARGTFPTVRRNSGKIYVGWRT